MSWNHCGSQTLQEWCSIDSSTQNSPTRAVVDSNPEVISGKKRLVNQNKQIFTA
jgi:hypothetical protein